MQVFKYSLSVDMVTQVGGVSDPTPTIEISTLENKNASCSGAGAFKRGY